MTSEIPQLSTLLARERLLEGATLLDVRNPDEREAGFAPDSAFVPLPELGERLAELDAGGEYVVVCELLVGAGFSVSNLEGGMKAWEAAGLPVVDEAGGIGHII